MTESEAIHILQCIGYAREGAAIRSCNKRIGWVRPTDDGRHKAIAPVSQVSENGTPYRVSMLHPTQAQAVAWLMVMQLPEAWALIGVPSITPKAGTGPVAHGVDGGEGVGVVGSGGAA